MLNLSDKKEIREDVVDWLCRLINYLNFKQTLRTLISIIIWIILEVGTDGLYSPIREPVSWNLRGADLSSTTNEKISVKIFFHLLRGKLIKILIFLKLIGKNKSSMSR